MLFGLFALFGVPCSLWALRWLWPSSLGQAQDIKTSRHQDISKSQAISRCKMHDAQRNGVPQAPAHLPTCWPEHPTQPWLQNGSRANVGCDPRSAAQLPNCPQSCRSVRARNLQSTTRRPGLYVRHMLHSTRPRRCQNCLEQSNSKDHAVGSSTRL